MKQLAFCLQCWKAAVILDLTVTFQKFPSHLSKVRPSNLQHKFTYLQMVILNWKQFFGKKLFRIQREYTQNSLSVTACYSGGICGNMRLPSKHQRSPNSLYTRFPNSREFEVPFLLSVYHNVNIRGSFETFHHYSHSGFLPKRLTF